MAPAAEPADAEHSISSIHNPPAANAEVSDYVGANSCMEATSVRDFTSNTLLSHLVAFNSLKCTSSLSAVVHSLLVNANSSLVWSLVVLSILFCAFPWFILYSSWYSVKFGLSKYAIDLKDTLDFFFGEELQVIYSYVQSDLVQDRTTRVKQFVANYTPSILTQYPVFISLLNRIEGFVAYPIALVLAIQNGPGAIFPQPPLKRKHEEPSPEHLVFDILNQSVDIRKRRRKSNTANSIRQDFADDDDLSDDRHNMQEVVDELRINSEEGKEKDSNSNEEVNETDEMTADSKIASSDNEAGQHLPDQTYIETTSDNGRNEPVSTES